MAANTMSSFLLRVWYSHYASSLKNIKSLLTLCCSHNSKSGGILNNKLSIYIYIYTLSYLFFDTSAFLLPF